CLPYRVARAAERNCGKTGRTKNTGTASCGRIGFVQQTSGIKRTAPIAEAPVPAVRAFDHPSANVLPGRCRQVQAGRLCSPEVKALSDIYERVCKRTSRSLFAADSLFAHRFRPAVVSWRPHLSGEWLAFADNFLAGDRLHGLRAHVSHAFQPAR